MLLLELRKAKKGKKNVVVCLFRLAILDEFIAYHEISAIS